VIRRREQVLFLVVGAWNTIFGYAVWAVLQATLGTRLPYVVVIVLAWPLAVLNAYLMHRKFVFRSHASIRHELPRFSTVYVAVLAANLVVLPVAVAVLPASIYLIQALFTCAVVIASYLGHKYYSFMGAQLVDDFGRDE
jgi:putative flippase GtrA